MRVLVINTNREKSPETAVPLGVCCVASAAMLSGHDVAFLDLCFEDSPTNAITETLARFRPEVVGLSICNLDNRDNECCPPEVQSMIQTCRAASHAKIVIGGPAVSQEPSAVGGYPRCDFAVSGEGEIAFPALLRAISSGSDPASIPGITVTASPESAKAPRPIRDLSSAPDPQPWRWLDLKRYESHNVAMPIQTKRGCGLDCAYCVYPLIEGREWRLRDPLLVADDVANTRSAGLRKAEIVDCAFGLPQDHAVECCQAISRHSGRVPLRALGINPAACTRGLIEAMNHAGFSAVGITADSASDTILDILGKNFSSVELHAAADRLRSLKAVKSWRFVIGGPGETEATVTETARFIGSLPASDLVVITHAIRILPGARISRNLTEEGVIDPSADLIQPVFYHSPHITPEKARGILENAAHPYRRILPVLNHAGQVNAHTEA